MARREMNLAEWMAQLPKHHLANRELDDIEAELSEALAEVERLRGLVWSKSRELLAAIEENARLAADLEAALAVVRKFSALPRCPFCDSVFAWRNGTCCHGGRALLEARSGGGGEPSPGEEKKECAACCAPIDHARVNFVARDGVVHTCLECAPMLKQELEQAGKLPKSHIPGSPGDEA